MISIAIYIFLYPRKYKKSKNVCKSTHSEASSETHCSFHPPIIFRRENEYTLAAIETESTIRDRRRFPPLSFTIPRNRGNRRKNRYDPFIEGKKNIYIYIFVFQESARWTEMRKSLSGSHRQWSGGKAPWRIKRPITMGTFINGITRCRRSSEIRGRNITCRIGRISFWRGCSPC